MSSERKMQIFMAVLCFATVICMIVNVFMDIKHLDTAFYILMGIYWIVFMVFIYISRKMKNIEKINDELLEEEVKEEKIN